MSTSDPSEFIDKHLPTPKDFIPAWDKSSFAMLNDKHEVIPVSMSFIRSGKWEEWFKNIDNRRVRRDYVNDYLISTVFLVIDHNLGSQPPLWFETMVFYDPEHTENCTESKYQDRYTTWDEAVEGHKFVVELAKTDYFND